MLFYSHAKKDPETFKKNASKLLETHLREVASRSGKLASEFPDKFMDKSTLIKTAEIIGWGHDFGKATKFFQDWLLHDKRSNDAEKHGLVSALFSSYAVDQIVKTDKDLETPSYYLPLISYLAVVRHHGNLSAPENLIPPEEVEDDYVAIGRGTTLIPVGKQIDALRNDDVSKIYAKSEIIPTEIVEDFLGDWKSWCESINDYWWDYKFDFPIDGEIGHLPYFILLSLYSILIDSDKKSAADYPEDYETPAIPNELIDRFRVENREIDHLATSGLNGARNSIYETVTQTLESLSLENDQPKIYTITAPTGSGKTFTGFSAALKLRAKMLEKNGMAPKIIYSLPFTSIIDQNFDVIHKIFKQMPGYKDDSFKYLLKHHHLADLRDIKEKAELEYGTAELFMESWDAEIIVTTFVQLFHTLIGFKNSFLKKFHTLSNSIILLDETQNIPDEYWYLTRQILKSLTEIFNCRIILMTATAPLIFEKEEIHGLLDKPDEYFSMPCFSRTEMQYSSQSMTLYELADLFKESYNPEKSYLLMCNTKKSSKQLINLIKDNIPKDMLFYLSTSITPFERDERIKKIDCLLRNGKKPVLVSTQVVEAGVDLDFDEVYRDRAPLDSLIQTAGRCNRNADERYIGEVKIFNLIDDEREYQARYSGYIYGKIQLQETEKIISAHGVIEEKQYYKIAREYFTNTRKILTDEDSKKLWKSIKQLSFDGEENSVSSFKLIKDFQERADVFIEINDCAENIWQQYKYVLAEKDWIKRREKYSEIKKDFLSYIVSVNIKKCYFLDEVENAKLYHLDRFSIKSHYNLHPECGTGFESEYDNFL